MASINLVQIIGNIGRDPEMRYTPGGQAVTQFSVATNRRWQKDGEWQEETTWFRCIAWGQLAERLADTEGGNALAKGDQVYVQGRIQTRQWEAEDGSPRYGWELVADKTYKLGRREGEGGGRRSFHEDAFDRAVASGDGNGSVPRGAATRAASVTPATAPADDFDDLPF